MKKRVFGPGRSRVARKPSVQCPKVIFYRCEIRGSICRRTGQAETESGINCCNEEMGVLVPVSGWDLGSAGSMGYRIVGGCNDNTIRMLFHMEKGYELEWLYLRTFTGGYMRYIIPGKRPPCVFALMDEGALSYCDKSPCLEYIF